MDTQTLATFFMWCSIINGSLLLIWSVVMKLSPDFVYNTRNKWISLPREQFTLIAYSMLGLYKIFILVFNIIPWVALRIMG